MQIRILRIPSRTDELDEFRFSGLELYKVPSGCLFVVVDSLIWSIFLKRNLDRVIIGPVVPVPKQDFHEINYRDLFQLKNDALVFFALEVPVLVEAVEISHIADRVAGSLELNLRYIVPELGAVGFQG